MRKMEAEEIIAPTHLMSADKTSRIISNVNLMCQDKDSLQHGLYYISYDMDNNHHKDQ